MRKGKKQAIQEWMTQDVRRFQMSPDTVARYVSFWMHIPVDRYDVIEYLSSTSSLVRF